MPAEPVDLVSTAGPAALTFASGTPFNDVEYSTFDTDYSEGETSGYDTFIPVDPADDFPGGNTVKLIRAVSNPPLDRAYGGAPGDRIVLGVPGNSTPYFRVPDDDVDDDYAAIQNFDFTNGHIQLSGSPEDYGLVQATSADGAATDGWYLTYTLDARNGGDLDLIAFVYPCDQISMRNAGSAALPTDDAILCNPDKALDLSNTTQFRFPEPDISKLAVPGGLVQTDSRGKEIVGGITSDSEGNAYLFGASDGNLDARDDPDNEMFITRYDPDGSQAWVTELGSTNGALLFDAVTDSDYLYAVGRTFGALPGFTNGGVWDGVIVKVRLDDGTIVDTDQWGNAGIDGYGAVTLDDAGNLYVSGAGSPPAGTVETGDNSYLVAKHSAATLDNIWRQIEPVLPTGGNVAEAWCGVTYIPAATPGDGRLVAGGWFGNPPDGAEGFLALYDDLGDETASRIETQTIGGEPRRADWILDNDADEAGSIYAVGFTTGDLDGAQRGAGDAYIVKYDPDLRNPVYRQLGTPRSDQFREVMVAENGTVYAIGYTYGDLVEPNADPDATTGDIVVFAFDSDLNPIASTQFGTPGEDRGFLAPDGQRILVGGMTEGNLVARNSGSFDAFALLLDPSDLSFVEGS